MDAPIMLPLTAVRFTATDGSVFVVEDGRLVARPVSLGAVRGSAVEIKSGIDASTSVVADARGKVAGDTVEVSE